MKKLVILFLFLFNIPIVLAQNINIPFINKSYPATLLLPGVLILLVIGFFIVTYLMDNIKKLVGIKNVFKKLKKEEVKEKILKDKIYYLNRLNEFKQDINKRLTTKSVKELKKLTRDFYKTSFNVPYQFTFSELAKDLQKQKKDDAASFLQQFSNLYYKGEDIPKEELFNLTLELENITHKYGFVEEKKKEKRNIELWTEDIRNSELKLLRSFLIEKPKLKKKEIKKPFKLPSISIKERIISSKNVIKTIPKLEEFRLIKLIFLKYLKGYKLQPEIVMEPPKTLKELVPKFEVIRPSPLLIEEERELTPRKKLIKEKLSYHKKLKEMEKKEAENFKKQILVPIKTIPAEDLKELVPEYEPVAERQIKIKEKEIEIKEKVTPTKKKLIKERINYLNKIKELEKQETERLRQPIQIKLIKHETRLLEKEIGNPIEELKKETKKFSKGLKELQKEKSVLKNKINNFY